MSIAKAGGDIDKLNQEAYRAAAIVAHYSRKQELLRPEATILNLFRNELAKMRFLDIGVGGGRTTWHIAPLVKEYLGVDYSEAMIACCQQLFPNQCFKVMDVRAMTELEPDYFDFVLFSYNGLDSINHKDRLLALREMKRVCKINGYVCFSSHNLQSIDQLFQIRFSFNPFIFARRIYKSFKLRRLNQPVKKLKQLNYAIIHDGTHDYKICNYYINPAYQIQQLSEIGFKNIKLFSYNSGGEIDLSSDLHSITDFMIYYLCNNI